MGHALADATLALCQTYSAMAHVQDGATNFADSGNECGMGDVPVVVEQTECLCEPNAGSSQWIDDGRLLVDGALGITADAESQQFIESIG